MTLKVESLVFFEAHMREARGWKRGDLCKQLGISQAKWRRHVEDRPAGSEVSDRTLALAMAALWADLAPFSQETANA